MVRDSTIIISASFNCVSPNLFLTFLLQHPRNENTQIDYISDAPAGHGLIKVGGGIVLFINEFSEDTSLYWLMTTKPGEG